MSELTDRSITALRAVHDELAALVRACSDDELTRTSGAADWDVAQVYSHLGSGAEIGLAVLTAGLAGDPPPDGAFNQRVWDRWNALDHRAQADGYAAADERLVRTLEGLPAEVRETASFTWFLPFPVGIEIFAAMRLTEVALHAWDVRVATDPGAALPAEAAGPLLDALTGPTSFVIGFLGKPDGLDGTTAALEVRTTDPERRFGLTLGPQIGLGPVPEPADGVLSAPAEAVNRLIAGRLRPEHTPDGVDITGPVSLDQLRRVFPGY